MATRFLSNVNLDDSVVFITEDISTNLSTRKRKCKTQNLLSKNAKKPNRRSENLITISPVTEIKKNPNETENTKKVPLIELTSDNDDSECEVLCFTKFSSPVQGPVKNVESNSNRVEKSTEITSSQVEKPTENTPPTSIFPIPCRITRPSASSTITSCTVCSTVSAIDSNVVSSSEVSSSQNSEKLNSSKCKNLCRKRKKKPKKRLKNNGDQRCTVTSNRTVIQAVKVVKPRKKSRFSIAKNSPKPNCSTNPKTPKQIPSLININPNPNINISNNNFTANKPHQFNNNSTNFPTTGNFNFQPRFNFNTSNNNNNNAAICNLPFTNTNTNSMNPPNFRTVCTTTVNRSIWGPFLPQINPLINIIPKALRPIAIDGSNVAYAHGKSKIFSCRGIQICVDYFIKRGHAVVKAFVPQFRRSSTRGEIQDRFILDKFAQKMDYIVFTPSRRLGNKLIYPYDDRFILDYATQTGAVVVSNDNYRDLIVENAGFRETVEKRLLMFTFADDIFMVPEDPMGLHGPSLDKFLSCS